MEHELEVIAREACQASERPPLLFVHGACHAAWCWAEHFLDFFAARGFCSYAVSLRGHGASGGRDRLRWASVAQYVDDVRQVAATLTRAPIVIGHSLGGLVVQKYLEAHAAPAAVLLAPSPARGMLWSGSRLFLRHPLLFLEMFLTLDPCRLYASPGRARKLLFSRELSEARVADYAARFGGESFRAFGEMVYSLPNPGRIRGTPLLVLGGSNDAIVPSREIERTAEAYGGVARIIPGAAHDMMLDDKWEEIAEAILEWLERELDSTAA